MRKNILEKGKDPLSKNRTKEGIESRQIDVVFYDFRARGLNLEVVPQISESLKEYLGKTIGRATVFLGDNYYSHSEARQSEKLVTSLGGLANLRIAQMMGSEYGLLPPPEALKEMGRNILSADLIQLITSGEFPAEYAQLIRLASSLDDLKRVYNFDIVFESHPDEVGQMLKSVKSIIQDLRAIALDSFFEHKDFEMALGFWRNQLRAERMRHIIRYNSLLSDLARRAEGARMGSLFFALLDFEGFDLTGGFRQLIGSDLRIKIQTASRVDDIFDSKWQNSPLSEKDLGFLDLPFAKDLIEYVLRAKVLELLQRAFGQTEGLKRFAYNFNRVYASTKQITQALSMIEIKSLCLWPESLPLFIKNSSFGTYLFYNILD
ncbi:MAG: hypothetical protein Q7S03_03505 [bacterium]|nr:hypothetical protein [bacterium]